MKFIALVLLLNVTSTLFSQDITPNSKIKTSGAITDFFHDGTIVILSTDAGTIESYNYLNGRQVDFIQMPEMLDFMGDPVPTKVYSIDKVNDKLLIVTQGNHGFRNVFIKKGEELIKIMDADLNKMLVKKARFINEDQVLLALMSNDFVLFNPSENELIYNFSVSPYTFSDFSLDADRLFVYTSDESGIVHKINVQEGKVVEEFSGNNVDNVYKLVYKKGSIITAGQDRRVGVFKSSSDIQYYLQKDFLVYCVGLHDKGTIGAFTADEDNAITIFDLETKIELYKLKGHQGIVTRIEFIDDQTIISSSEDGYLMVWKLINR